jgi:hypothetical protein
VDVVGKGTLEGGSVGKKGSYRQVLLAVNDIWCRITKTL